MSTLISPCNAALMSDHHLPMKRLLLVSYHFPPVGGAGVQRPLKFVKYLRRFGWDTTVLMAANPSVPVFDESLLSDVPAQTVLLKAPTWEPSYRFKSGGSRTLASNGQTANVHADRTEKFTPRSLCRSAIGLAKRCLRQAAGMVLQPDPQILWAPNAYREACRHLTRVPHDAILATAPPYSNLLLGRRLKQKFSIPLVVDFRDEWDLSSQYLENGQRDWFSRTVQRKMQNDVLKSADAIIATTKASTSRLRERSKPVNDAALTECIYNGFDDDDFAVLQEADTRFQKRSDRFRIVYTGTLWNLTTIEPLVHAILSMHKSRPELTDRLELVVVGRKTPEQLNLLERLNSTGCQLVLKDYCSHAEALSEMQSSDALCLLLGNLPGAERVVPAKLFEYLALRKPILSIVPEGETAGIARAIWPDHCFHPHQIAALTKWLIERVQSPRTQLESSGTDSERYIFRRDYQAGQLAHILNRVVSSIR